MTENSRVTGRVFTKLFFSFVVVLFVGMAVLDFSLRQVVEQSLRAQAEESLASEARLLAAHLKGANPQDLTGLQQIASLDGAAAGTEIAIFNGQGQAGGRVGKRMQEANLRCPPRSLRYSTNINPWAAPGAGRLSMLPFPQVPS